MLSHEDSVRLICEAQSGNESSFSTLTIENTPLVKSIVKRYLRKNVDYDDLMQLGSLGLIKAIKNFNLDYNVQFSTYAVPMIAGEIKRYLRDDGSIKVSRSTKALYIELKKFIDEYRNKYEKTPELELLAANFDVSIEDIVFTLEASKMPISLCQKLDSGKSENSLILMERIADKNDLDSQIDKMVLKELIKTLTVREQKIILLRFYRDKTQAEVAELLNVSQVQVSRLETKILSKLKSKFTSA